MPQKIAKETLHDGQVVRLILDAPKANVLDSEMMNQLQGELDALARQPHVKLIQFTGRGDHFSFGASVAEHTRDKASGMLTQFHRLFYTLADLAIPTASVVSGRCLGGAMELVLMCNFLFVDRTAQLGQPEILLGVFPPPASLLLPMKVGQAQADEIVLTGRSLTSDEASGIGLLTAGFGDRPDMESGVEQWVQQHILPKSASSLRYAVRAVRWEFNRVLKEQLAVLQLFYIDELMMTQDANEGIQAFLEKRTATWKSN